jgi:hypothetical protein
MKKITLQIVALTVLFFATASSVGAVRYEISCNRLSIAETGGERKFYVSCDSRWTITTDADWVSANPSSGSAGTDSVITLTVKENPAGKDRKAVITFAAGGQTVKIPLNQFDTSTGNFWADGELIHLHKSGKLPAGLKPVPVLLFGNGWDLEDLKKGGLYEQFVQGWTDLFLQQNVIKEMQDYIDIYAYCAVSGQRGNIPFSAYKYEIGARRDMSSLCSNATFALKDAKHPNYKAAANVDVTNGSVGGWNFYCHNRAGGSGQYAAYGNPEGEQHGQYWWTHEFIGHCLSNMPDFYYHNHKLVTPDVDAAAEQVAYDELTRVENGVERTFVRSGSYAKCREKIDGTKRNCETDAYGQIIGLTERWDKGFWWNTDWESDPTKVVWKEFIGKSGYDNVGVYAGGNCDGTDGFYRPENWNVMENAADKAPEVGMRYWIYSRLLERAGVPNPYNFTNPDTKNPRYYKRFMEWDVANGYADNANGSTTKSYSVPPILTLKYWKEKGYLPLRPSSK